MSRVQKTVRDAVLKIGFDNNHVVTGKHKRNNKGPARSYKVKIPHQYVIGDNTAVEKHGDHIKGLQYFASRHIFPGNRICSQEQQDHGDYRTAGHINKRIEKRSLEQGVSEYRLVGLYSKIHGPKEYLSLYNGLGFTERAAYSVKEGIKNNKPRRCQKQCTEKMKHLVAVGSPP
jgi:hypothetical protein